MAFIKNLQQQINYNICYTSLLKSKRKGRAYILNVESDRTGSEIDYQNMQDLFKELGYDVVPYKNQTDQEINDTLDKFVKEFNADDASSVVVLMSHGREGFIQSQNGIEMKIQRIVDKFRPNNCRALANKPKMFFIQACRGELSDIGAGLEEDYCEPAVDRANGADTFIAYASIQGYKALRYTTSGSWFVQAIMEEFIESAHEESLDQLMKQITARVSTMEHLFYDQPTDTWIQDRRRQTSEYTSTLTTDVYFFPHYPE
ncbi:caspase-2-like [Amphiura filiformis]|uniref:caspase-2-like n=1 Tax=Amphiura filiformis TaxID=82378 RepID=UPI003B2146F1